MQEGDINWDHSGMLRLGCSSKNLHEFQRWSNPSYELVKSTTFSHDQWPETRFFWFFMGGLYLHYLNHCLVCTVGEDYDPECEAALNQLAQAGMTLDDLRALNVRKLLHLHLMSADCCWICQDLMFASHMDCWGLPQMAQHLQTGSVGMPGTFWPQRVTRLQFLRWYIYVLFIWI